jgi:hypothetical protein
MEASGSVGCYHLQGTSHRTPEAVNTQSAEEFPSTLVSTVLSTSLLLHNPTRDLEVAALLPKRKIGSLEKSR